MILPKENFAEFIFGIRDEICFFSDGTFRRIVDNFHCVCVMCIQADMSDVKSDWRWKDIKWVGNHINRKKNTSKNWMMEMYVMASLSWAVMPNFHFAYNMTGRSCSIFFYFYFTFQFHPSSPLHTQYSLWIFTAASYSKIATTQIHDFTTFSQPANVQNRLWHVWHGQFAHFKRNCAAKVTMCGRTLNSQFCKQLRRLCDDTLSLLAFVVGCSDICSQVINCQSNKLMNTSQRVVQESARCLNGTSSALTTAATLPLVSHVVRVAQWNVLAS